MTTVAAHGIRLTWPGRGAPKTAPKARIERVQQGSPEFVLVEGDNLAALSALRSSTRASTRPGPFALAYLDPPFFTGREHSRVARSRNTTTGRIVRSVTPAFDDRWDSLHHYLAELGERVTATRELLVDEGCMVLHVDPKTSHYAKILCDEIFGSDCFASEIVWRYRRWPAKTRNFQRIHDVLLRYVKNPDAKCRFHQLYEPLAASTQATWGTRRQRAVLDEQGRRVRSSSTAEPSPGTPLGDVWEIGIVAPVARERTGYPTQKPEALLERLIQACTEPGDSVLDPYAGSGTTLAAAATLGRRALGIDANPEALDIARARLEARGIAACRERVTLVAARPGLAACVA